MGLFGFLKKNEGSIILGAAAKGSFVTMADIPDEVFSAGVLGPCCGIDPAEGKVYAPADGTVTQLAETLHAIGLETSGVEVLLHVGVDTVEMSGDGFTAAVREGQSVKKGDLLLTMELEKIKSAGHPTVVIMAVTNADSFAAVEAVGSGAVQPSDDVMRVSQ